MVSSVEDFLKDFVRLEEIGALGVDVLHPTGEKVTQHREKLRPRRMSDAVLLAPTQIVLCMAKLEQECLKKENLQENADLETVLM